MTHGPYNVTRSHDPWVMQCCTTKPPHGPWVVQQSISMPHGLYNASLTHGSWVVQHLYYPCPMDYTTLLSPMTHGLYNTCTTHAPWVVQHLCHLYLMAYIRILVSSTMTYRFHNCTRVPSKSVNTSSRQITIFSIHTLSLI